MRYPGEPEVGVGAVVLEGGRILLVRRANPPGRGKWSVPGGHLRLGESVYETAVRELEEETGVKGDPLGIVNVDEYVEVDEEGRIRYHYVLVDVLVRPKSDPAAARPSSDALEVKLCTLEEALRLDLTRSTRSLIEKLARGERPLINSNFIVVREGDRA
ncbi:hypothetical protein B6U99_00595 [Candidatus Geothermarchaeota archaeon ex4572_27]|nr:MAG: hypothetical protein B6U99_00595 [Candidatus Geothermarchaeota archaeon ex4572_27]